jgi:hypothetical protein
VVGRGRGRSLCPSPELFPVSPELRVGPAAAGLIAGEAFAENVQQIDLLVAGQGVLDRGEGHRRVVVRRHLADDLKTDHPIG